MVPRLAGLRNPCQGQSRETLWVGTFVARPTNVPADAGRPLIAPTVDLIRSSLAVALCAVGDCVRMREQSGLALVPRKREGEAGLAVKAEIVRRFGKWPENPGRGTAADPDHPESVLADVEQVKPITRPLRGVGAGARSNQPMSSLAAHPLPTARGCGPRPGAPCRYEGLRRSRASTKAMWLPWGAQSGSSSTTPAG